jgi:agmatine deiminase
MIRALQEGEKVFLLVNDLKMREQVCQLLAQASIPLQNIRFYPIPTVDVWLRDTGPIFLVKEEKGKKRLAMVNWIFNAWGRKYLEWEEDNILPEKMAEQLELPLYHPGIVLEGGSVEGNGHGTLLTTEQCLLNPNRNPTLSKEEIENYLKEYLGVQQILWLKEGIVGDDTDGHVDDIARFVNLGTVVCAIEENRKDENHAPLQENYERLQKMTDPNGNRLKVITLPMPNPVEYEGVRLPASYANFYIGNRVVLVPTFDHPNDGKALETLQRLFPERRVVGIPCNDVVIGLGAFHCVTQQHP